jgi:hypothetical protein
MKKVLLALTSMTTTAIAENSLIGDELNQTHVCRQAKVKNYLNNLDLKEVRKSETLKDYIKERRPDFEMAWSDGFIKAEWNKAK